MAAPPPTDAANQVKWDEFSKFVSRLLSPAIT